MVKKVISPVSKFSGTVSVPPDKSLTHRAILFSSLADGDSTIENPLMAADCLSTARCVEELGIKIEKAPGLWTVHGNGLWGFKAPTAPFNCGNSGTTMRLLSGILAAQNFQSQLMGDASLTKRPMNRVADPLKKMGARFTLRNEKFSPMTIHGTKTLRPIHWKNPVASAQVKSAVLLAALHTEGETIYEEPTLSRDHTERMLAACGVPIERSGTTVKITGPAPLKPQQWVVPNDISSAAFFLVGAITVPGAKVRLTAVNVNPTRTGIIDVLKAAGADIKLENERTVGGEAIADIVAAHSTLKPIHVDAEIAPRLIDEIPVLAVAAARANGASIFTGIEELRYKETDRIYAIARNLSAMGGRVEEKNDGFIVHGPTPLHGAFVNSYEDHRIAMAFAIAALHASGATTIDGADCVSISFPNYWDLLDSLCGK